MTLDYYVIAGGVPDAAPEGIVVEEFTFDGDHCAVGLDTAGWSVADGRWWSSAEFGRGMRDDLRLRARLVAVDRAGAEGVFGRHGGGELPGEPALREHFRDRASLYAAPPLRLDDTVPVGYREQRLHRVLFAGDPAPEGLTALRSSWGAARLAVGDDLYAWELRRIGQNVAWCLDLTAWLGGDAKPSDADASDGDGDGDGDASDGDGDVVGRLLHGLTGQARRLGLIPVTVERLR
jgi:hypothetical protein